MRITVTAIDQHPTEGYPGSFHDSTQVGVGQHVIVSPSGVCLDGEWVIARDRRTKRNRTPGHPWIVNTPEVASLPVTSFTITIETERSV